MIIWILLTIIILILISIIIISIIKNKKSKTDSSSPSAPRSPSSQSHPHSAHSSKNNLIIPTLKDGLCKDKEPSINDNKVCIFDIDNTLTIYEGENRKCANAIRDTQPSWPQGSSGTTQTVIDTLKKCDEKGFVIAIATAETGGSAWNDAQKKFIKSLAAKANLENSQLKKNKKMGTAEWFNSPLYQNSSTALGKNQNNFCESVYGRVEPCEFGVSKIPMIMNILNYLNIEPNRYNQSIMFDDGLANLTAANQLGLQTFQASQECGGRECKGGCGIGKSALDLLDRQPPFRPGNGQNPFTLKQYHGNSDNCSSLLWKRK